MSNTREGAKPCIVTSQQCSSSSYLSSYCSCIELRGEQGSTAWLRARTKLAVTGADVAAAIGCSGYKSPHDLKKKKLMDMNKSDEALLAASKDFANVHTIAGHVNEDPIAVGTSRILFDGATLHQPGLCIPLEESERWYGASIDRISASGSGCHATECKFSFKGVPEEPKLEHVFQCMLQMRVAKIDSMFLSYGTRTPTGKDKIEPIDKWPRYEQPLEGDLCLRIFWIMYTPELWEWMYKRMKMFRDATLDDLDRDDPALIPQLYVFTRHVWFESPVCRDFHNACPTCTQWFHKVHPKFRDGTEDERREYLPPTPAWSLCAPTLVNPKIKWIRISK